MFNQERKIKNEDILNIIYDFVLDPNITERERKVGLMAKADLENGKYPVAVLNRIVASFNLEAVKQKSLSHDAEEFYTKMHSILVKIMPIGTNLGVITAQRGYLD